MKLTKKYLNKENTIIVLNRYKKQKKHKEELEIFKNNKNKFLTTIKHNNK